MKPAVARFVTDPSLTIFVQGDQQPEGVRDGLGEQAGPVSAERLMTVLQMLAHGRRAERIRQGKEIW